MIYNSDDHFEHIKFQTHRDRAINMIIARTRQFKELYVNIECMFTLLREPLDMPIAANQHTNLYKIVTEIRFITTGLHTTYRQIPVFYTG